jgi:anti-anti-sigma factor
MQVDKVDLGDAVTMVRLNGKLDFAGSEVAGMPLATAAGASILVIVDMTDVSFVASIGVRHLVMAAKTMNARKAKLVLMSPNEAVEQVLTTMGIVQMIPIVRSEEEARRLAAA